MVGVRGQVKADYCVPMPRHTQTSLSIHLRLPGQLQSCPEWLLSNGDAACRRRLGVLGVLESGKNCSSKIFPGKILTLLAFGPVSLRLLDLGVPEAGLINTRF